MNIYDKLNDLTLTLKNSEEFKRYKAAAEMVDSNKTHSDMLKDFISLQLSISTARMLGQQPDDEQIEHFNTLYTTISNISSINEFLQAQMVFSRIMEDITKEISKATEVDAEFLKIIPDLGNFA